MTRPALRDLGTSVLFVAAAFVAGCASPPPESFAEDATAVVRDRLGTAPTWRDGTGATPDEDARVRALLAHPLDEGAAVEIALVRSRHVQALLERAIGDALEARADAAPVSPVLDVLVRWPHGSGGPHVEPGLLFGLLDILRMPGRRDAADLAARASALDAADAIVETVSQVRETWIEAVAARQREALDADVAEAAAIAAELARRQYAAGTLAELDMSRLVAFGEEARIAHERAVTDSAVQVERLVRTLGVFGDEAMLAVPAGLPSVAAEHVDGRDFEQRAVARRIDLERARVEVIRTRLAAGIAGDAAVLPWLDVGASFERDSDGSRSSGPVISLELPVSERGDALAEASRSRAREAENRLYDLAVRIRSEVREAVVVLDGASAIAALYEHSIVPLRATTVEQALRHYNGMLIGVYDLLTEKREELRARRDAVDATRDTWLARVRLERALGEALPATPAAPPPAVDVPQPVHEHMHMHGGR